MERNLISPTITNLSIIVYGYFHNTTSLVYSVFNYYPELKDSFNKSTQDLADEQGESMYFND